MKLAVCELFRRAVATPVCVNVPSTTRSTYDHVPVSVALSDIVPDAEYVPTARLCRVLMRPFDDTNKPFDTETPTNVTAPPSSPVVSNCSEKAALPAVSVRVLVDATCVIVPVVTTKSYDHSPAFSVTSDIVPETV